MKVKIEKDNRESWLRVVATEYLIPWIKAQAPWLDTTKPWAVACGKAGHRKRADTIGVAVRADVGLLSPARTVTRNGGGGQIWVWPSLEDPVEVTHVLLHELLHIFVGFEAGHGSEFKRAATACGLEGKMTATRPGEALTQLACRVVDQIGSYPHAALVERPGRKGAAPESPENPKRSKRRGLHKCACPACGWGCFATAKNLEMGVPDCPVCGERCEHPPLDQEEDK